MKIEDIILKKLKINANDIKDRISDLKTYNANDDVNFIIKQQEKDLEEILELIKRIEKINE